MGKKKKKSKKASKTTAEEDLLGLSLGTTVEHEQEDQRLMLLGQSDNIKLEVNCFEAFIENNTLHFDVTLSNVGDTKMSQITLTPTNLPAASTHLTKSIKPGVSK